MPVSYTHLDVYKRQAVSLSKAIAKNIPYYCHTEYLFRPDYL